MVSSRDRSSVSVEDRLALSAERRRLRFSFQINDVKDPTEVFGPASLRPAAAKSGVSSRRSFQCQPAPESPLAKWRPGLLQGAKLAQGRRGASLISPERFDWSWGL